MTTTPDRLTFPPVSPMIAAGSRFPIVQLTALPAPAGLSELGGRSFLLRFAEPVMPSMYGTRGSTPKTTGTAYMRRPGAFVPPMHLSRSATDSSRKIRARQSRLDRFGLVDPRLAFRLGQANDGSVPGFDHFLEVGGVAVPQLPDRIYADLLEDRRILRADPLEIGKVVHHHVHRLQRSTRIPRNVGRLVFHMSAWSARSEARPT